MLAFTMASDTAELSERKAAILRAVVEGFVSTARPVGSGAVSSATPMRVSSATVRKEMVDLEETGYLFQPHTSAGRIPTDKGYRYFVDALMEPGPLDPTAGYAIKRFFEQAHGEVEAMLRDTSQLLSSITDYAAVVVGPDHDEAVVRSVQLVDISSAVAVLVIVLSDGWVEKRTLEFPEPVATEVLARASTRLSEVLIGLPAGATIATSTRDTGDVDVDAAVNQALSDLHGGLRPSDEQVFVGGTSSIARAFDATETVRDVLSLLEKQYVVITLIKDVLDRGLSVAIGTETGVEPLNDCSVVVAPYEIEGEQMGSIAVLGPTHMDYPSATATVAVVSRRLGQLLSEK
jgi:heat-inducible transcriptional repressor